jgi:hypothetical protein
MAVLAETPDEIRQPMPTVFRVAARILVNRAEACRMKYGCPAGGLRVGVGSRGTAGQPGPAAYHGRSSAYHGLPQ